MLRGSRQLVTDLLRGSWRRRQQVHEEVTRNWSQWNLADTHFFQRSSGAKIGQKSILKQPVEGDLILDAVDTFKEQNDGGFVLRRQTSGDRCRGHHLCLTVLTHHLNNITNNNNNNNLGLLLYTNRYKKQLFNNNK